MKNATSKTFKTAGRKAAALCAGAVLALLGGAAQAQVQGESYQGPAVPPELRNPAPSQTAAASGSALQQQALQKLRRRFEEADLDSSGRVTEEEAKRAGLGFIAGNFAAIDTARTGAVSFDDVKKFMQSRQK